MRFFYIEPEVAGGFGKNSLLDHSFKPPRVARLHCAFDGWMGDALVETFPCLIATNEAVSALKTAGLRGVEYAEVEVSTSELFRHLYPNLGLPDFEWLQVIGTAGENDFGIAPDRRFVISERALDIIRPFGLSHAEIAPFP
jgi:hypothetical protein